MSQTERAALYNELKEAGFEPTKHYREYAIDELRKLHRDMVTTPMPAGVDNVMNKMSEAIRAEHPEREPSVPISNEADPNEMATMRRGKEDEPIRIDEQGRIWFQEEILKSATARPCAYRVFRELGTGTKEVTVEDGQGYTETFEVPSGERKPLEVKVGVPTWQVGIYKDPRLPIKVITYRNAHGYDREEVEAFFGGADLLPENVVDIYVGNLMCYDIRSVNTAIQREFNLLQRKGISI